MNFVYSNNCIYLKNEENKIIAEVTFPFVEKDVVEIDHTFVDESLRGQGIADKLLKEVVKYLRKNNLKCIPKCSYAVNWFEKHDMEKELLYSRK